jgi:hypothetical protein
MTFNVYKVILNSVTYYRAAVSEDAIMNLGWPVPNGTPREDVTITLVDSSVTDIEANLLIKGYMST